MKPYLYNTTVRTAKVYASTTVKQKQTGSSYDQERNCRRTLILPNKLHDRNTGQTTNYGEKKHALYNLEHTYAYKYI